MKHTGMAVIAVSLLLAIPGRASAQPGAAPAVPAGDVVDAPPARAPLPPPPPAPVVVRQADGSIDVDALPPLPKSEELSEGTALSLSIGGTVASWALLLGSAVMPSNADVTGVMVLTGAVGVMYAPSLGHAYAGHYFTRGLGLRLGGLATFVAGAVVAFAEDPPVFGHDQEPDADDGTPIGTTLAIAGAAMFVAGTIDDIVTTPRRVRERNRERRYELGITPMLTGRSAGFMLGGRF